MNYRSDPPITPAGGEVSTDTLTVPARGRAVTPAAVVRGNLPYVAAALILSMVLSHIPLLGLLVFPFQLMATFVHESSHALVAMITGGQVASMVINADLSGETYTRGGMMLLIASAGYVGTAVAGALLLLVPLRHARATLWGLALLAVLAIVSFHVTLYTAFWGGLFAALCGIVAYRGTVRIAALLQAFIAVQLGLNAVNALSVLGLYSVAGGGYTDATNAAAASFLPAIFWTILWSVLALGALGSALWHITFPAGNRRLQPGDRGGQTLPPAP